MSGNGGLPPIPAELRADAPALDQTRPLHTFLLERLVASPVTLSLIGICSLLYYLSTVWGPGEWHRLMLAHMGERRWAAILDGEVYRLLAATFLHADFPHLLGNMSWLIAFGLLLEPFIGSRRTIVAFLITAVIAALPYLAVSRELTSMGSSGAILGLVFIMIGWRLRRRDPLPLGLGPSSHLCLQGLTLVSGQFFAFTVLARTPALFGGALIFALAEEVSPRPNIGHIGGAVAGLVLGYFGLIEAPPNFTSASTRNDRRLSVLAWLAAGAAGASLLWALAVGEPWRLTEPPALESVLLPGTPFEVTLPSPVRHDLTREYHSSVDAAFGSFDYGHWARSPVRLSIHVNGKSEKKHEAYAQEQMQWMSSFELLDGEARRVVTRVTVGDAPAACTISQFESFQITRVNAKISGMEIEISGFRETWAAQTLPPVWEGVEQRVLASFRFAR